MKRLTMPLWAAVWCICACACNKVQEASAPVAPADTTTSGIPDDPYKDYITYTIQQGSNYCEDNVYDVLEGPESIDFRVVFDSSCIYENVDPLNQRDINKLMGFSDCNSFHQRNSARFGWNWMDDHLYLYAYCYNDGERIYKTLTAVPLNEAHHLKMYPAGNTYIFEVNGHRDTMPRFCSSENINGYKLLPYFGGDEPAPHTMRIRIRYLD